MTALFVTVVSHRGLVRQGNEDRVVAGPWVLAPDAGRIVTFVLDGPGAIAVLDGMGGHAGGEVAAAVAAEVVASLGGAITDEQSAESVVNLANQAVYDRMSLLPQLAGMGSTIVGVVLHDDQLLVFNVGDSRAYLVADGYLVQMSTDDAAPSGALTASLGGRAKYEPVRPHIERETAPGKRILLATDGVFGHVEQIALEGCVAADDSEMVDRLLALALERGGPDNVSIALVRVQGDDREDR